MWEMEHARRAALRVTRLASIESVASRLPRLMAWCSVVKFDLSGRGISSEGFKILARVLGQCPSLATLNLGCNHIGDEGARSLARVLGQCSSLAELYLSENRISDDVIAMIRTRIQDSTKLFASYQFPEPDDDESDLEDDESDLDDDESDW